MKRAALLLALCCSPAHAQMSSTAAPVANSSGSVTNQAVQVVPSSTMRYNFAAGTNCPSTTLTINPFVSSTYSFASPYEAYYDDPVYSDLDLVGDFDPEGNPIPDGQVDEPGKILYYKPVRTGQKNNTSINGGITAQITIPLDRRAQRLCLQAAEKQVQLMQMNLEAQRLNYELKRQKQCGLQKKSGITFAPWSPFAVICKDIVVAPAPVEQHTHRLMTSDDAKP